MEINSKDITVYSLNPDVYSDRTFYIQELRDLGLFKAVERVVFNYKMKERLRTIITAHIYALIKAFDSNAFPLLLLEDDARLMKEFPKSMNIPNEASLVYLGGSTYNSGVTPNVYIQNYNSEYYRVYYMLCAHAILVMNKQACKLIIDRYVHAIFNGIFNDQSLGLASKDNVFLTPKDGMYFYQKGVENVTKFEWKNRQNLLKK